MFNSKKMHEMFNRLLEHTPCHSQMHYEVMSFFRGVAGLGVYSRAMFESSKPRQRVKLKITTRWTSRSLAVLLGASQWCLVALNHHAASDGSQTDNFSGLQGEAFEIFGCFLEWFPSKTHVFHALNFSPRVHRFGLNAWEDLTWNC